MRLSPKEEGDLAGALYARYDSEAKVQTLLDNVGRKFKDFAVTGTTLPANIRLIVEGANGGTWLRQLLNAALADAPEDAVLLRLQGTLDTVLPENVDPFDVCCLAGTTIMVNREILRSTLRDFDGGKAKAKRILTVRSKRAPGAEAGTMVKEAKGESHSLELINFAWDVKQSFLPIVIDIEEMNRHIGIDNRLHPWHLGDRLVRELGYPTAVPPVPVDSAWARWTGDFMVEFGKTARDEKRYHWIVLDQLNRVPLSSDMLDFIKAFAIRVAKHWLAFRLALLGYTDVMPSEVTGKYQEEPIGSIDDKELKRFLDLALKQAKKARTPADVDALVQRVLARVTLQRPESHALLQTAASDELAVEFGKP